MKTQWCLIHAWHGKQRFQFLIDELRVDGIQSSAGEMSPHAGDLDELRVGHLPRFPQIVAGREVEVDGGGQNQGGAGDRLQCGDQIAVESFIVRNVGMLPCVQHAEQIVGVPLQEEALPESRQEFLQRVVVQFPPALVAIERLREAPSRVHACDRAQTGRWLLLLVMPLLPRGIRDQCMAHPLEEDEIVRRRLGRSAEGGDALHHVGEQTSPLVGLLRSHGPADDQFEGGDAKVLRDEAMLADDIVVQHHLGEAGVVVRSGGIVGRRREPVSKGGDNDNEIMSRIQGHSFTHQPLIIFREASKPSRIQNGIRFVGIQLSKRLEMNFRIVQCTPTLQRDVSQIICTFLDHPFLCRSNLI